MLNYIQTLQGAARTFTSRIGVGPSSRYTFRDGPIPVGLAWAVYDEGNRVVATDLAPAGWQASATRLIESPPSSYPVYYATQDISVIPPVGANPGLYNFFFYYCGFLTVADGVFPPQNWVTPFGTNPSNPSSNYSYGRDWSGLAGLLIYVCSDWTVTGAGPYWNAATNTLTLPYDPHTNVVPTAPLTFSLVSQQPPLPPPPYTQGLDTFIVGGVSYASNAYDFGTYRGMFTGAGNPPPYNYLQTAQYPGPRGPQRDYKILQLLAARDTTGMSLESAGPFSAFYSDRSWGIPASLTLTSETVNISPNVRDYPFPQTNVQRTITVDVLVGNPVATANPYVVTTQGGRFLLDKFILIHLVIVIPPLAARKVSPGDQMDMAQDHASGLITIVRSIGAA